MSATPAVAAKWREHVSEELQHEAADVAHREQRFREAEGIAARSTQHNHVEETRDNLRIRAAVEEEQAHQHAARVDLGLSQLLASPAAPPLRRLLEGEAAPSPREVADTAPHRGKVHDVTLALQHRLDHPAAPGAAAGAFSDLAASEHLPPMPAPPRAVLRAAGFTVPDTPTLDNYGVGSSSQVVVGGTPLPASQQVDAAAAGVYRDRLRSSFSFSKLTNIEEHAAAGPATLSDSSADAANARGGGPALGGPSEPLSSSSRRRLRPLSLARGAMQQGPAPSDGSGAPGSDGAVGSGGDPGTSRSSTSSGQQQTTAQATVNAVLRSSSGGAAASLLRAVLERGSSLGPSFGALVSPLSPAPPPSRQASLQPQLYGGAEGQGGGEREGCVALGVSLPLTTPPSPAARVPGMAPASAAASLAQRPLQSGAEGGDGSATGPSASAPWSPGAGVAHASPGPAAPLPLGSKSQIPPHLHPVAVATASSSSGMPGSGADGAAAVREGARFGWPRAADYEAPTAPTLGLSGAPEAWGRASTSAPAPGPPLGGSGGLRVIGSMLRRAWQPGQTGDRALPGSTPASPLPGSPSPPPHSGAPLAQYSPLAGVPGLWGRPESDEEGEEGTHPRPPTAPPLRKRLTERQLALYLQTLTSPPVGTRAASPSASSFSPQQQPQEQQRRDGNDAAARIGELGPWAYSRKNGGLPPSSPAPQRASLSPQGQLLAQQQQPQQESSPRLIGPHASLQRPSSQQYNAGPLSTRAQQQQQTTTQRQAGADPSRRISSGLGLGITVDAFVEEEEGEDDEEQGLWAPHGNNNPSPATASASATAAATAHRLSYADVASACSEAAQEADEALRSLRRHWSSASNSANAAQALHFQRPGRGAGSSPQSASATSPKGPALSSPSGGGVVLASRAPSSGGITGASVGADNNSAFDGGPDPPNGRPGRQGAFEYDSDGEEEEQDPRDGAGIEGQARGDSAPVTDKQLALLRRTLQPATSPAALVLAQLHSEEAERRLTLIRLQRLASSPLGLQRTAEGGHGSGGKRSGGAGQQQPSSSPYSAGGSPEAAGAGSPSSTASGSVALESARTAPASSGAGNSRSSPAGVKHPAGASARLRRRISRGTSTSMILDKYARLSFNVAPELAPMPPASPRPAASPLTPQPASGAGGVDRLHSPNGTGAPPPGSGTAPAPATGAQPSPQRPQRTEEGISAGPSAAASTQVGRGGGRQAPAAAYDSPIPSAPAASPQPPGSAAVMQRFMARKSLSVRFEEDAVGVPGPRAGGSVAPQQKRLSTLLELGGGTGDTGRGMSAPPYSRGPAATAAPPSSSGGSPVSDIIARASAARRRRRQEGSGAGGGGAGGTGLLGVVEAKFREVVSLDAGDSEL